MDTITITLLGWGLYLLITYFEKRGARGKAIIATLLVSLVIILSNVFGNFASASQLGLPKLLLTVGASVMILSFFLFLPAFFKAKK
ncbi:hypothetical protein [Candidatus Enterococcus murrayae]|uniref:Uncharacterized protein n=1 Tax=Candidatus Enterococcus murrayae TaxID=2815321 RepID=A0ABS3HIL5_9ENTE|nr:hypothetical protein [Enterococcus sp. MJM16]MBO0453274.1 hypothetical protein [Enterococcus sp. MJM16]